MSRNMRVNLIANTSRFKSAMSESSSQIKLLNSEFKSAAAETDQYGNKLDSTSAKKKQLNGVIQQYTSRIKAIKEEQKHWTRELEKGNITEDQHAQKQQELARRLNNTEGEMKRYEGQLKKLNAEGKATTRTYADFDRQFRDVGKTMRDVGAQVGITAGVGFMAMKKALSDVVGEAKDFHSQMSEVRAISGATAEEMKVLTDQSKDLGKATKFTAQEAAESQANLARAGFNTNEILGAMPGMLDLAASSNLELGDAANITSNIIRTFNYDASKAGKVADVLAKGAATANTDVQGLGQAMEVAGPVANSLDIALEEVAASAGIMADAGIDGSKSGRMLRQGMLRLAKPVGQAGDLLEDMGVNAFDADGNMKSLDKVVAELEKGLKGQTKQQKAAALSTIFGSESTAGWTVLLDKGSDALKDYTRDLEDSEGAAKEMGDIMMDNADGAIVRMQSALSGLKIELGEKLLPILSKGADFIGDLANKMSEWDEGTVETIAQTALLVTAVLGVTTVVSGLVAGIGAFMMVAGPVGLAIAGGTLLLGGLSAALYKSKIDTEKLAEEQEKAKEEAIRYGEGLSEGTKKGVQGYTDLFEGAKIKLIELKNMSGEEAEKTVNEIQKAFSEMADTVVAELEVQRDKLSNAIKDIYEVAGEHGKESAEEITESILESFDKDIAEYKKASKKVQEIIGEYGSNINEYPEKVREAYDEAWSIMEQGSSEFARSQKEVQAIQKGIAEREGKIMANEVESYTSKIKKGYDDSLEAAGEWFHDKKDIIDQALAQERISHQEYDEMLKGIEAGTNRMFADAGLQRDKALSELAGNLDERGKLIDVATGKELERMEVQEKINDGYGERLYTRLETDEEYLNRWKEHNEEIIKSSGDFGRSAKKQYESNLKDFLVSMGNTEDEAIKKSQELTEAHFKELEKDDERAMQAGEDKGMAFTQGIKDTEGNVISGSADILSMSLLELSKGDPESARHGESKGNNYIYGLQSTINKIKSTGASMSDSVKNELSKTTDGGGGSKAGRLFDKGLGSWGTQVNLSGKKVAQSGKSGLKSVKTASTGSDFATGFQGGISSKSGSIWQTAWSLGSSALSALKSSIKSASPSKLAGEEGVNFTDGFTLAIDKGKKESVKSAGLVGKESLEALNQEVEGFKQSFGAIALAVEGNKQTLKVEHEINNSGLEDKISTLEKTLEKLINVMIKDKSSEDSKDQPIVMNVTVRDDDDINKIDNMLSNLGNRRRAAWGGGSN